MNRAGANPERLDDLVALVQAVMAAGLPFRGVHYYEGHRTEPNLAERTAQAHAGYAKLLRVIAALEAAQLPAEEVITSGTPALPCALAFEGFRDRRFLHRVSSGTVVYNDATSMVQLPPEYGLKPAALVIATVVSKPRPGLITCDAGHKTISADAGIPTCVVHDHAGLHPSKPSEEHLPISIAEGVTAPETGDLLYLVPRHVCPTVNNFDHALIISGGKVCGIERVSARGREMPLRTAATSLRRLIGEHGCA